MMYYRKDTSLVNAELPKSNMKWLHSWLGNIRKSQLKITDIHCSTISLFTLSWWQLGRPKLTVVSENKPKPCHSEAMKTTPLSFSVSFIFSLFPTVTFYCYVACKTFYYQ